MGVQGLWSLLQPAARPIKLEDLEGKRFAVDSSIWLYHFRMAMRDKEGRTLSNAHILGFFWRICKLLHYGLRPVFVFDGGAPVMKRQTLIGRKTRREGAKESHALAAKKLLNAQLRQAALEHVAAGQGQSAPRANQSGSTGASVEDGPGLGANVVYYDDHDAAARPSAPTRPSISQSPSGQGALAARNTSQSPSKSAAAAKKKSADYHKDPYALPSLDQELSTVTASTSRATAADQAGSGGPRRGRRNDFRFATDSELRHLLSSITPSDIDMSSPLFRSLPFELQYELVGDMRAASRGTSYKRLQQMLKASPNPIDFSKAQVLNLKNRNELTQRVLEVTDEIGDANIKVPIRVAGERNREYVLIRRGGDEAGFVLGVRNQEGSSKDKAIVVGGGTDRVNLSSDEDDDSDHEHRSSKRAFDDDEDAMDLQEVEVPDVAPSQRPSESLASRSPSTHFRPSEANNPEVRRAIAEQLINKRAEEHIREKLREKGIVDEGEVLEEQLRMARQRMQEKGSAGRLFVPRKSAAPERGGAASTEFDYEYEDDVEQEDEESVDVVSVSDDGGESQLEKDELQDLARALSASERNRPASPIPASDEEMELEDVEASAAAPGSDLEEVAVGFDATDYASIYGSDVEKPQPAVSHDVANDIEQNDSQLVPEGRQSPSRHLEEVGHPEPLRGNAPSEDKVHKIPSTIAGSRGANRRFEQEMKSDEGKEETAAKAQTKDAVASIVDDGYKMALEESSKSKPFTAEEVKPPPAAEPAEANPSKGTREYKIEEDEVTDEAGRARPAVAPLPKGDDLAATEILNEDVKERSPLTPKAKNAAPAVALEEEAVAETPVVPFATDPEAEAAVDSNRQALTPPPVSEQVASDDYAMEVGGVAETEAPVQTPAAVSETAEKPSAVTPSAMGTPRDGRVSPPPSNPSRLTAPEPASKSPPHTPSPAPHADLTPPSLEPDATTNVQENQPRAPPSPPPPADQEDSDEGTPIEWSPSPSPAPPALGPDGFPLPTVEELEEMDAVYEEEATAMQGDQSDIAAFISNTKGQGLIEAQAQIAREVEALRAEHINTRKSEEEITKQMAREIQMMLRLFGLPYITAPMEAEAQCAELVSRKLVDGIITDDSDVFLFGGTRVYKNMFNNNKVVECFLLSDVQRELGLDREKLVRLAYLLGSDYTEGLPSVGPVVAMEILSLFPGADGLLRFKEWWLKVQSGRDTPEDTKGKTMRHIKKTLSNKVHLDESWPNPAVLDAYYEPSVDTSDEPFQWGLPDLDNLRTYLGECLGWSTTKTDQYVVPVIEAQSRRSRARGNQSTLDRNGFFDVSAGTGVYAGRTLPSFGSSRLQRVVHGFREANKKRSARARQGSAASPAPSSAGKRKAAKQKAAAEQSASAAQKRRRTGAGSQPPRAETETLLSDEDEPAPASEPEVEEAAIGKAMSRQRPIVRREQMPRLSEREARAQLEANVAALEGTNDQPRASAAAANSEASQPEGTAASTSKRGGKGSSRGRGKGRAAAPSRAQDNYAPTSSPSSAPSSDGEADDGGEGDEWRPEASSTAARGARGKTRGAARARGRGRGRGGRQPATAVAASTEATPSTSTSRSASVSTTPAPLDAEDGSETSPAPRTRKPARARGARGKPRHPNLVAARSARLDGPIPLSEENTTGPVRPETMRRTSSTSSSGTGAGRSRSASHSRASGASGVGSTTRRRVEIELRSSGEEDEGADL